MPVSASLVGHRGFGRNLTDPGVLFFGTPSETHETNCSANTHRNRHHEAKLWLIDSVVPSRHPPHDNITDLPGNSSTEYTANEGANVNQTTLKRREVIRIAVAVDGRDRFRKDDEPANGQRVNYSAPKYCRVCEENEWPSHDAEPTVPTETTRIQAKGLPICLFRCASKSIGVVAYGWRGG